MPIETVTVAGKSDPEMGKKRGRIKSQDGKLFQAVPTLLERVNIGSTYDVEYENREFNGATFRVVESIVPTMGQKPMAAAAAQARPGTRTTMPMPVADDQRGTDIAVLAIIKEWVGRIPVGDGGALRHALKVARREWLAHKREDSQIETGRPNLSDELNDEIPNFAGPEFGEHGER